MDETKNKPVGVSLPADLLEKIDRDRGKIPRSVWIVDLLKKAMQETENGRDW